MSFLRFRFPWLLLMLLGWCVLPAHAADEEDNTDRGSLTGPGEPGRGAGQNARDATGTGASASNPSFPGTTQQPTFNLPPGPAGTVIVNPRTGRPMTQPDGTVLRREPLAPPKPSEFQKFVQGATGRLLPVFGTQFFRDAVDTLNPIDSVPVSADYVVGPGDEVVVRAWGSIDVDYRATVDRNSMLNLPKIGSFSVAGVKAADLERHLRAQIGRIFTNFNLNVALGQLHGVKVFVVGPAERPGVYTLPSQSTILSALVAAGGPGPTGSMRKVALRRDGKIVSELDVYDFLVQGDKSKDLQLIAGDVIVLQPAGPRIALTGAVDTRAIYELRANDEPLREVLRYAGGAPVLANPNKAQLERIDPAKPAARYVEEFPLDANGLSKPLHDGDVLTLLEISPQFANAVTLRGHVAQPLRYPFTPGMRIRDLIPDREALISPDFYRRKNLLVQMIDEDEENARLRRMQRPAAATAREADARQRRTAAAARRDEDAADTRPDGTANDTADLDTSRRRRDVPDAAREETVRLDPTGGRTHGVEEDTLARLPKAPTTLFDELNWDYATIERLNKSTLTTEVIPFNLGKAVLQGDPVENVALMPGDVVTIFSQKDVRVPVSRQTRLVSVEGEVNSPGVYQLQPGDTLKSVLQRAGGFTPQAYVYGLEFSREETRQRQRENLRAAIARLQALSAVQAARDAANRRDDATGATTSAAVSQAATQAQVARLQRIEPNGRVALELTPETTTLDMLPDLLLENADHVVVPSRPGFVTVAGAVANSNALVWKPGRTVGDYLALAGVDEAADPSNIFILRADGTVTKAGQKSGWFNRGGIESQVMQPGDALIVPTQLDFETWGRFLVRNLKDFAQIFSGFGIGIAAIHSL
jgi:protein involved in polysaccharide export with SLBB domain